MSGQDPGAATGRPYRRAGICQCRHLEVLHRLNGGLRKACTAWDCGCTRYRERKPVPAPPRVRVDRDGVRQRYAELAAALDSGAPTSVIALLALMCADDIPALLAELDGGPAVVTYGEA